MIRAIDVRPGEARAPRFTVDLPTLSGPVTVVLRLRWLPGPGVWALHVQTPSGGDLSPQLVAAPGGEVLLDTTHPDAPTGRLLWIGPERYSRTDLGRALRLLYDDGAAEGG